MNHILYYQSFVVTEPCLKIFDIENCGITEYKGNYSEFIRQKQMRARDIEREGERLSEMLLMEENAIRDRAELNRRIQANHSEDAVLLKKLTNMNKERNTFPAEKIITSLYRDLYVPERTVEVYNCSVGYDGEAVLRDVSFSLIGGERLCIVGANGCGKSTLMKALTGKLKLLAGKITWGVGSCIDFNRVLSELDDDLTPDSDA